MSSILDQNQQYDIYTYSVFSTNCSGESSREKSVVCSVQRSLGWCEWGQVGTWMMHDEELGGGMINSNLQAGVAQLHFQKKKSPPLFE